MSISPESLAPLSANQVARIKQDAERGIGASSGDTLRLAHSLERSRQLGFKSVSNSLDIANEAQALSADATKAHQQVTDLSAENERLRGLLAQKMVDSTMLTGLVPEDGGMTLGFKGGACGMLAQLFGDQFYESGAVNYLEFRFDSATRPELGPLVVTLQRAEGLTPTQKLAAAESKLAALSARQ